MTHLAVPVRRAAHSRAMDGAARVGLVARGVVYVVMGWLAADIARRHGHHEANSRGALTDIARQPFGIAVLWVLAAGFVCYAVWRLREAVYGSAAHGDSAVHRLSAAVGAVVYAGFAVGTVSVIAGTSHRGQAQQQVAVTARVMGHTLGRWLVGAAGIVVVVVGVVMMVQGLRRAFEDELQMARIPQASRHVVVALGVTGNVARGLVFAVAGGFIVDAAVTFSPQKSSGLNGALRALAGYSYGPWLLTAVAAGLVAFGLYGLAAARWAKT